MSDTRKTSSAAEDRVAPVVREAVATGCPECGHEGLERYPVLSEGGWWSVVKCPSCLHSASREKGPRLGVIELLSDRV